MHLRWQLSYTLEQSGKEGCRGFQLCKQMSIKEKVRARHRGKLLNNDRRVRSWKMADCFTLLKRITRLKNVISAIRSRIHSPTWKGIPRRVHATVTNPAWIAHLLRTVIANSDVECIWRAKTPTISWHEKWIFINIYNIYICIYIYIYIRIITVDIDPPAATYMRPGAGV